MTDGVGPTQKIAEFVHGTTFKDIPPAAIEGAKLQVLDTIGIGLAALEQPVAKAIQEYVRAMGGAPVATVMGMDGYRTSPPLAALANGCFFNMLDLDNHTATFVLPTVLAVGEMVGATGERVLEAYIVAAEATARMDHTIVGKGTDFGGPTARGWHHVTLTGSIGAALAASKLLGLDVSQMLGAMGTASVVSGGVRQNMATKAKSVFSGNAAGFGVSAALLAQRGVTGGPDILEGRGGLIEAVCFPGEADYTAIMEHLGSPFQLAASVGMGRYPAIGNISGMIETLQDLRQAHGIDGSQVTRVEARLTPHSLTAMSDTAAGVSRYPEDGLAAEGSWSYAMAATLLDGTFTLDHVTDSKVKDPRYRELAAKMEFIPLKAWSNPESVTVHLASGQAVTAPMKRRRYVPQKEDFAAKFRECAGRHLGGGDVEQLYQRVLGIEKLANIGELTAGFAKG